ncbi:MAG: nuclear transport factor 2 family protein [Panacagrimonas sp.]
MAVALLGIPLGVLASSPSETVDAFHKALRTNHPDQAIATLTEDAIILEQGFAESSRTEWVEKQLGPAVVFARDSSRRILRRSSGESGDTSWVISSTRTTVDVPGTALVLEGAETAILRRENGNWRIMHLHWSAHDAASGADQGVKR